MSASRTSPFDKPLALNCAKIIEQLYRGTVQPTLSCADTDTQVLIERIDDLKRYDIIFPGTASLHDWLTDARIRKIQWGNGKAHCGFADALRSVIDQIKDRIPYNSRLIISGHSLGGALATLCADALHDTYSVERVITFGSPRVFNATAAANYNDLLGYRTSRIVNSNDPIPHVPWCLATYRHVDTQVYLAPDHSVRIDEPLKVATAELLNTFEVATTRPTAAFGIAAPHHIASYIRKLETLNA